MWKAEITKKSAVDASGQIEVTYEVSKGEEVLYPNLTIKAEPSRVVELIQTRVTQLKEANDKADEIELPKVIEI
jgi:hypothetical protein